MLLRRAGDEDNWINELLGLSFHSFRVGGEGILDRFFWASG